MALRTVCSRVDLELWHDCVLRAGDATRILGLDARRCLRPGVEGRRAATLGAHEAQPHAGDVGESASKCFSVNVAFLQAGDENFVRDRCRDCIDEAALGLRDRSLQLRFVDDGHLRSAGPNGYGSVCRILAQSVSDWLETNA